MSVFGASLLPTTPWEHLAQADGYAVVEDLPEASAENPVFLRVQPVP